MNTSTLLPAVSSEAILAKSKVYVQRALRCKAEENLDEYQLWASLALELLGKTCLAQIHPSLIVNPHDQISLFAASGVQLGTDIKTIAAHTLYDRLRHVTKGFDESVKKFCDDISQRRNAELHSGEVPFREMKLSAWEGRYWHAAQLLLDKMGSSLEEWLGADQAKAPKSILQHARQALVDAALVRVERAKEDFLKRRKKDREDALRAAEGKKSYNYTGLFRLLGDAEWATKCPACTGKAYIAGVLVQEIISEQGLGDHGEDEAVDKLYAGEEFKCPVCGLHLDSQAEVEATGLSADYEETEIRERRYEEEYNNE
jgi:hypothetical protein